MNTKALVQIAKVTPISLKIFSILTFNNSHVDKVLQHIFDSCSSFVGFPRSFLSKCHQTHPNYSLSCSLHTYHYHTIFSSIHLFSFGLFRVVCSTLVNYKLQSTSLEINAKFARAWCSLYTHTY
jgi:hypothetical protein